MTEKTYTSEIEKILSDLEEMQTVIRILSTKIIEIKESLSKIDISSPKIIAEPVKSAPTKKLIPPSKISRVIDPLINEIRSTSLSSFDVSEIIRQSMLRLISDSGSESIHHEVEKLCDEIKNWSVALLSESQKEYIIKHLETWRKTLSGT